MDHTVHKTLFAMIYSLMGVNFVLQKLPVRCGVGERGGGGNRAPAPPPSLILQNCVHLQELWSDFSG